MTTDRFTRLRRRPRDLATAVAVRHSRWSHVPLTLATLMLMLGAVWLREGDGRLVFPGLPLLTFTLLAWSPLLVRTFWPLPVLAATVVAHALHLLLLPRLDAG